ncbi:hypothetical protein BVX97_01105 [bacterium E08(2017)]|nr:hypothetical protein BVX97_01105 [bacterium E08(2017)]
MIRKTIYLVYGLAIFTLGVFVSVICRGDIAEMTPLALPALALGAMVVYSAVTSKLRGIVLVACWLNIVLCAVLAPLAILGGMAYSSNPLHTMVYLLYLAPPIVVMIIRKKERKEGTQQENA